MKREEKEGGKPRNERVFWEREIREFPASKKSIFPMKEVFTSLKSKRQTPKPL